jgi:hypothetical protein
MISHTENIHKKYAIEIYNPFEVLNQSYESQKRMEAFEILANRQIMNKVLKRTKLCKYGSKCKRKVCTFAHSIKELQPAKCLFGESCRFINHPSRKCTFLHPNETKEEFVKRTGLEIPGKVEIAPKELIL